VITGLIAIGLTNDAETRRAWREVLLSADNGDALAGAILFAETLRQTTSDGTPFPELLARKGILVGVKVDLGLHPVDGSPGETWTSGLDGLHDRCRGYYALGARFAKWRCALKIDASKSLPSDAAVRENASTLARYARIAQQAGLVPIVEPEVCFASRRRLSIPAVPACR
jgi:fructose-bisphosphate aldolase, class I